MWFALIRHLEELHFGGVDLSPVLCLYGFNHRVDQQLHEPGILGRGGGGRGRREGGRKRGRGGGEEGGREGGRAEWGNLQHTTKLGQ